MVVMVRVIHDDNTVVMVVWIIDDNDAIVMVVNRCFNDHFGRALFHYNFTGQ